MPLTGGAGPLLAHAGSPPAPHDLPWLVAVDPVVVGGLALLALGYVRGGLGRTGRSRGDVRRRRAFWTALGVLAVALVGPLEPLSAALASAHMVQHLLLTLAAAPLLAVAGPGARLLRGTPPAVRRTLLAAAGHPVARLLWATARHPVVAWLAQVLALWVWHAALLYDAAVGHHLLHGVAHLAFLGTAVLFWSVVLGPRRVPAGVGVLMVFGAAMQGVLLSALLTFADQPFYAAYRDTAPAWGLTPLADQQLAAMLMWIPSGFLHVVIGLRLLARWVRDSEVAVAVSVPGSPSEPVR